MLNRVPIALFGSIREAAISTEMETTMLSCNACDRNRTDPGPGFACRRNG